MAGDSIRMEHGLADKPEFLEVMAQTGMPEAEVFYALFRLWTFFDLNTVDGLAPGVSREALAIRCKAPGAFVDALASSSVRWLEWRDGGPWIDVRKIAGPNGTTRKKIEVSRARNARHNQKRTERANSDDRDALSRASDIDKSPPPLLLYSSTQSKELPSEACGEPPSADTPPPTDDSPTVAVFPVKGPFKTWKLSRARVDRWREHFPDLDVDAELRAALSWCEDNPARRKTATGMPAFLGRWLAKEQNRGRAAIRDGPAAKPARQSLEELIPDNLGIEP